MKKRDGTQITFQKSKKRILLKPDKLNQELEKKDEEITSLKRMLDQKELELSQMKEQVQYKNQQLASKEMEMEAYKNITEDKIIKLEAKIKELEAKLRSHSLVKQGRIGRRKNLTKKKK